MATEDQWKSFTKEGWPGLPSPDAIFAREVRATPLNADAILRLLWDNVSYFGDTYYESLSRPIEMRVEEYFAQQKAADAALKTPTISILGVPETPPQSGDWVVIDNRTNKLRRATPEDGRRAFQLPMSARFRDAGIVEWDSGEYLRYRR